MLLGDTFIVTQYDCHLWILLSDPTKNPEKVVIVSFTTHTVDEEQTCVVEAGEHPFVKHRTAVRYKDGKTPSLDQLQKLEKSGMMRRKDPLSEALLKKVLDGVAKSRFLPIGCRKILEDQELI